MACLMPRCFCRVMNIDKTRGPTNGWVISGRYTAPNQTGDAAASVPFQCYSSIVVHVTKKVAQQKARECVSEHGGHWKVEPNYIYDNWSELVNWRGPSRPRPRRKL